MGNNSKGRYYVLGAICLAALVLPLSFTGGAVATPTISKVFQRRPICPSLGNQRIHVEFR